MSAHTPGPWKVVIEGVDREPCVWTDEGEDLRIRVARVACDGPAVDRKAYKSALADARLIAAAPDLLAACESSAEALDECARAFLGSNTRGPDPELLASVIVQVRAAIANARRK